MDMAGSESIKEISGKKKHVDLNDILTACRTKQRMPVVVVNNTYKRVFEGPLVGTNLFILHM